MFQFKADCNDLYCGNRSVEFSRSLNPELQTLDRWMAAINRSRDPSLERATTSWVLPLELVLAAVASVLMGPHTFPWSLRIPRPRLGDLRRQS